MLKSSPENKIPELVFEYLDFYTALILPYQIILSAIDDESVEYLHQHHASN